MTTILGTAIALMPLLTVFAVLLFAEWRDKRRNASHAWQIELTDAIHRELGAAAAPVVEAGSGGEWLVKLTVPLDRPALITSLLAITDRVFASRTERDEPRFRIVLTPAPLASTARVSCATARRSIGARRAAVAAAR